MNALLLAEDATSTARVAGFTLSELLDAGGAIGWAIISLSFILVYLVSEHLLTTRRPKLIPPDLAEDVHRKLSKSLLLEAVEVSKASNCFLGHVLAAGLTIADFDYEQIEKAMEDCIALQTARLSRRLEYLTVIGAIAPMLGLLGTVWGMILTFREFESKAHPAVAELAPGIYRALVTTLFGLCVAIPAFCLFAVLRNRLEDLIAEGALTAEHVLADLRREKINRAPQKKVPTSLPPKS